MTQTLLVVVLVVIAAGFFAAILIFALRFSESRRGREIPGVVWLLVPLVIGALSEMFRAWGEGWDIGDTIGAIAVCLLLAACLVVYRKRHLGAK